MVAEEDEPAAGGEHPRPLPHGDAGLWEGPDHDPVRHHVEAAALEGQRLGVAQDELRQQPVPPGAGASLGEHRPGEVEAGHLVSEPGVEQGQQPRSPAR
jgi:hypothetical protein